MSGTPREFRIRRAVRRGDLPHWRGQPCHICQNPAIGYSQRGPIPRPICKPCNRKGALQ